MQAWSVWRFLLSTMWWFLGAGMENCGFTHDEAYELLCQGVKPWDNDAWDGEGARVCIAWEGPN